MRVAALVLALAWTGHALAATCADAPSFGIDGAVCGPADAEQPCGCSETLSWDAVTNAQWYEIWRCETGSSDCLNVGSTRSRNRSAWVDVHGVQHPAERPTFWIVAWDEPFPRLGVVYEYAVKACREASGGEICSQEFSNWVQYATAPYMCIANGIEVPCVEPASGQSRAGDRDGDGLPDSEDPDDDNDGVPDGADDCPLVGNTGQRDADGDGVGDACDLCPGVADPAQSDDDGDGLGNACDNCAFVSNADQADSDRDGAGDACDVCVATYDPGQQDADLDSLGDACDNCTATYNPAQEDRDHDRIGDGCDLCPAVFDSAQGDEDRDGVGDACDVCPLDADADQSDGDSDGVGDACDDCPYDFDPSQADRDLDGVGDRCDLQDDFIYVFFDNHVAVRWQPEWGRNSFGIYTGDLDVLRESGVYTQEPGSNPLARMWCRFKGSSLADGLEPGPGRVAFYLVTGFSGGREDGLGEDGSGYERYNSGGCP